MKVKSLPFTEICTKIERQYIYDTYIYACMHVYMYACMIPVRLAGCPLMICAAMENRIYHFAILRAAVLCAFPILIFYIFLIRLLVVLDKQQ